MKLLAITLQIIILAFTFAPFSLAQSTTQCEGLLNFESKRLHSEQRIDFCEAFTGKTLLVVNTASQCGFTPQFKQLETLYQKYKAQGLEVIGFPSNSFRQEYSNESRTASVCYKNFGVTFTMLAPSDVKGPEANIFYKRLAEKTATSPDWNFNKYLISKDLKDISVYKSNAAPIGGSLEKAIKALVQQ